MSCRVVTHWDCCITTVTALCCRLGRRHEAANVQSCADIATAAFSCRKYLTRRISVLVHLTLDYPQFAISA